MNLNAAGRARLAMAARPPAPESGESVARRVRELESDLARLRSDLAYMRALERPGLTSAARCICGRLVRGRRRTYCGARCAGKAERAATAKRRRQGMITTRAQTRHGA